jgi:hypothetical protein
MMKRQRFTAEFKREAVRLLDVVTANGAAEFADHTLSAVEEGIFSGANKLREIILDLEAQRLDPARGSRTGVREERATYHALPARLPMGQHVLCRAAVSHLSLVGKS